MRKLLYVLLTVLLFSSCSIFKKSAKKHNRTDKQTESVQSEKENNAKDDTSVAKVEIKKAPYKTCSFKCKTAFKGMPVSVSVRTTYDSIFWLSASSLGIEAMRIKATKDSVYMVDKLNKENVRWNYERTSVYAGLPLTFDFIQDLFTDTTLVKSYNTAKFSGTIVKKLTKVNGVSLPEQINIDGTLKGKPQKIQLNISNYKLNNKNEYPFDFQKSYKLVK